MDVEIDDADALQAGHLSRPLGRDGDVVEQAKAHRLSRRGVVSGRSYEGKGCLDVSVQTGAHRRDRPAGSVQGRFVRAPADQRVNVDAASAARRQVGYQADHAFGVHTLEISFCRRHGRDVHQTTEQPRLLEVVHDRDETRRALGMVAGDVLQVDWVIDITDAHTAFPLAQTNHPQP